MKKFLIGLAAVALLSGTASAQTTTTTTDSEAAINASRQVGTGNTGYLGAGTEDSTTSRMPSAVDPSSSSSGRTMMR